MVAHDAVIKVWQKAWKSNLGVRLGMRMFRSKLKGTDREINPRTCTVTCLPCELVVCPLAIAVHLCSVGPVGELELLMLLDLLWEVLWGAQMGTEQKGTPNYAIFGAFLTF